LTQLPGKAEKRPDSLIQRSPQSLRAGNTPTHQPEAI